MLDDGLRLNQQSTPYTAAIAASTNNRPQALVTGIAGQDGSYLAELLLSKGYAVHGLIKSSSDQSHKNLAAVRDQLTVSTVDLTDLAAVRKLVEQLQPQEIYNLAAPSVVGASWNDPPATVSFMTGSTTCLLEAIVAVAPGARFFQASSSEIFRGADQSPQSETTPTAPTSPYGIGKVAGHTLVKAYRERHGLHASSGILYNHESPRRPIDFVPSKIVHGAVQIKLGNQDELSLGDLAAQRDWGFAGDYVEAMWQMLQQDSPDDYVVATGVTHTVGDLVAAAFDAVDLEPDQYVRIDPRFFRQSDEALLVGDPTKIADASGWRASTSFQNLIEMMIESSLAEARGAAPHSAGPFRHVGGSVSGGTLLNV